VGVDALKMIFCYNSSVRVCVVFARPTLADSEPYLLNSGLGNQMFNASDNKSNDLTSLIDRRN